MADPRPSDVSDRVLLDWMGQHAANESHFRSMFHVRYYNLAPEQRDRLLRGCENHRLMRARLRGRVLCRSAERREMAAEIYALKRDLQGARISAGVAKADVIYLRHKIEGMRARAKAARGRGGK